MYQGSLNKITLMGISAQLEPTQVVNTLHPEPITHIGLLLDAAALLDRWVPTGNQQLGHKAATQ